MSDSAMEGITKLKVDLSTSKGSGEPVIDPLIEKVERSLKSSIPATEPSIEPATEPSTDTTKSEPKQSTNTSAAAGGQTGDRAENQPMDTSKTEPKPTEPVTSKDGGNPVSDIPSSSPADVTTDSSTSTSASTVTSTATSTTAGTTSITTTTTTTSSSENTSDIKKANPACDGKVSVTNMKPIIMETELAEEYTKKLEKTIETCKTKLGIDESQLEAEGEGSEDSEDESESESESELSGSDSEYCYRKRKRRSQYRSNKRPKRMVDTARDGEDVEELLSEKERFLSNQLLKLLKDGLQSTIKDAVHRTLTGQPPAASSPASQVSQQSTATSKQSEQTPAAASQTTAGLNGSESLNGQISDDSSRPSDSSIRAQLLSGHALAKEKVMEVTPVKQDNVNRVEPLSEPPSSDDNQENKALREELSSNTEPMNNEMVEKLQWKHKCEIEAIKHNAELATLEMRKAIETEKERALWRLRKQLEHKFKRIIEETKKKQWCAMCGKEAIFYCCWNTSYCDYPCQQKHWPSHLKTCAQIQKEEAEKKSAGSSSGSTSSQPPPNPPNNAHSPSSTSGAPPPYMPTSTASASEPASGYQLMSGPVQYMPVPSNSSHVYQAQVPVQTMPIQGRPSRASAPSSGSSAPLLYPVMQPPSAPGPPPPQGFMVQQRHAYRIAPKY